MNTFSIHYCNGIKEVLVGSEGDLPNGTAYTIASSGGTLEVPYIGCVSSVIIDSSITYTIDSTNSKIIFNVPRNRTDSIKTFNFSVVWCIGDSTNAVITQEVGSGFYYDVVIAPESGGTVYVPYYGCITSASGLSYTIDTVNKVVAFVVPTNYTFDDLSYTITAYWCDGTESTILISQPIIDINMCKCFVFNHDGSGVETTRYRIPCNGNSKLTYTDINNISVTNASVIFKPCTTIVGESAFENESVTSVTFHNNITSVEDDSFRNCYGLEELTLLEGTESIGANAFRGCTSLTSITIPSTIEEIGTSSFNDDLRYVDYLYIRSNVYLSTMGLRQHDAKNVTIGGNVTEIPSYVFNRRSTASCTRTICSNTDRCLSAACTNMRSLVLESSVVDIDDRAFENCSGLTSVTLSTSLDTIGVAAFYNTTKLPSVIIPSSVQSIGEGVFNTDASYDANMKLKENYPNYISFDESTDFTAITFLSEYPPTLEGCLFRGTIHFKVFVPKAYINNYLAVEALAPYVYSIEEPDILINRKLAALGTHYSNDVVQFCDSSSTSSSCDYNFCGEDFFGHPITIDNGSSTLNISDWDDAHPSRGTVGSLTTTIGDYAFDGMDDLITITISSSVTMIGYRAFYRCYSLDEVIFESTTPPTFNGSLYHDFYPTVTYVPDEALSAYRQINVGMWVDGDGSEGFDPLVNIQPISYLINTPKPLPSNNYNKLVFGDCVVTTKGMGDSIKNSGTLKEVVFSKEVEHIHDYAFYNCFFFSSVTFNEGSELKKIGDYSFWKCTNLKEFIVPSGVTSIGMGAFQYTSALTRFEFAEGSRLTSIGEGAFDSHTTATGYERSGIRSITIPSGVSYIGASAFTDCVHLSSITFDSGSVLTTINNKTFYGTNSLSGNLTIPSSVTTIDDKAFQVNTSYSLYHLLTSVTFESGSSLTTIGNDAFNGREGLVGIELPSSIVSIGDRAFYHCYLEYVICNAIVPPSLGIYAFGLSINPLGYIYVPSASVNTYKSASGWSDYADRIQAIPTP